MTKAKTTKAKTLELTPTGFKIGSKGHVINTPEKAAEFFGSMPKPEARRIRRQLHAAGKTALAAVPRRKAA